MIWRAYITRRPAKAKEYICTVERFELPNTTVSDMRVAVLHAAKLFKVSEDNVLCLPDRPVNSHRLTARSPRP